MTTIDPIMVQCFVCDVPSEQFIVGSSSTFGASDLDTRPAEMTRSTMSVWIQRCPVCGYRALEVNEGAPIAGEIVKYPEYTKQLKSPEYPQLASDFLCWKQIAEHSENWAEAGWAALHAAWASDDEDNDQAARICRAEAVQLFQKAQVEKVSFGESSEMEAAILTDILRRSTKFEEAGELAQKRLLETTDELIRSVFEYQIHLALIEDSNAYTIEDAQGFAQA